VSDHGPALGRTEVVAFDEWACYYDLVHEGLPGEAEFYVGLAVRTQGRALELGAGTGRIAIPMAMSGVDVLGIDNSMAMLAQCRAKKRAIGKTSGRLTLVCADMKDFALAAQFRFIAMAYRTFMHLLTPADRRACLETVRRHLSDDGIFVMNSWVPSASYLAAVRGASRGRRMQLAGRYPIRGTDITLVHYHATEYDERTRLLTERHLIREVDARGHVLEERVLPLVRTWQTPREVADLLQACGFEVDALYGDFACSPFSAGSTEMIWIAKKKARGT